VTAATSLGLNANLTIDATAPLDLSTNVNAIALGGNTTIDTTGGSSQANRSLSFADVTGNFTLALATTDGDLSVGNLDVDTFTLTSGDDLTLNGTLEADTALDFTNLDEIFLAGNTQIIADDAGTPKDITFDSNNTISSSGHYQLTISGDNVTLYQVGKDTAGDLGNTQITAASNLNLHGDFHLDSSTSLTLGGTIAPGGIGVVHDTLEIDFDNDGSFTIAAGSTLHVDMSSDSNYDQLDLNNGNSGTVDFGSASISGTIVGAYSPGSGDDYRILKSEASGTVSNTGPTQVSFGGETFDVEYTTGTDVDLNWIAGIWKWTAGAATNAWSNAGNWDLGALVNGAKVEFDTANLANAIQATTNDVASLTLSAIVFVDGGFSISGNGVTLTDGITNTAGANAVNIALAIPATSDQTFTSTIGTLTIGGAVTLGSALDIEGGGAVVFGSTLDGTQNVTVDMNAASGSATFNGAVGNTNELATLLITDSNAVTFANILKAQTVDIQDTTGTVAFQGNTTLSTGLTTAAQGYSVAFTGATITIAGDTTLVSTGGVAFGALSTDTITFAGGLDTTAVTGGTTIAGTVATTDTDMDLGFTTMAADATLKSGSGALNVASITDGANSYSLDLQDNTAASTGTVTFTGNVSINDLDTFAQPYAVVFQGSTTVVDTATTFLNTSGVTLGNNTGDSTTFTGGFSTAAVAGGTSIEGTVATTNVPMVLGATTMTDDATLKSGSGAITVASITDGMGSYSLDLQDNAASTGTVTFTGNVAVNDLDTFAQPYAVVFQGASNTIETNTSFLNKGTVTFGDGSGDSSTFTGVLDTNNGPSSTIVMGTLSSGGNAMDLGDTTTDAGAATNFTASTLTFHGTLTPGGASVGTVNVNGNLALANTATLDVQLGNTTDTIDQVNVTGTVNMGGATLSGTLTAGTPANGTTYELISNDAADAVSNQFAQGIAITIGGKDFTIDYAAGDGNDVVLEKIITSMVWDGGSVVDSNWMTPENWVNDVVPDPGDSLEFAGAVRVSNTNNFAADTQFESIIFSATGFTLSGNSVDLTDGVSNDVGSNAIALPITVASAQTFSAANGTTLNVNGGTTLNDGLTIGGAGTVNFGGSVDGTQNLTVNMNAATGTANFNGAVGNANPLATLLITDSSGVTFANTLNAQNVNIQDTTGTVAFQGNTTISAGLTTAAEGYDVAFTGTTNSVAGATAFLNTGTVTLGDNGDATTFVGGLDTTGNPSATHVSGTVLTTDTGMSLGPVTLDGNATLDTGTGAGSLLGVGAVTGGGFDLVLDSGPNAAADMAVASVANVGILTVRDSGGATFAGSVDAATVDLQDTTGTVAFQGNTTIGTGLTTAAMPYDVSFTGATNNIAGDTNFLNTGALTFGDGGDTITFAGGLDTTGNPSMANVNGTVATTNTRMDLDTVTMLGNSTLVSGSANTYVASITDNDNGYTLSLQDGTATGITRFSGTMNVGTLTTFAGNYDVYLLGNTTVDTDTTFQNTGVVILGDAVGDTLTFVGGLDTANTSQTRITGTVVTTDAAMDLSTTWMFGNATLRTGSGALDVDGITDGANSYTLSLQADTPGSTGAVTFSGPVTVNAVTTFGRAYDVAFNDGGTVDADTNFLNTGTLALGDGGDTITFVGGLATTGNATNPSQVNIAGTVQTTNTQMDLGPVTLAGNSTFDTGIAAAGVLNVGAVTGGGFDLILDSGADALADTTVASVANVGTLTVRDSGGTRFVGTVGADTVALQDTTGTIAFEDNTTIGTGLTTAGMPYDVAFTGGTNTIAGATAFVNTGTVTLGDNGDTTTFVGGLDTTAGPSATHVSGTVKTTDTTMSLGPVTLDGDATLDTGTAAGSLLGVGAVTGGGFGLVLDSGPDAAADMTVASVANVGVLTVRDSGGATFTGAVGAATVDLQDTTGTVAFQGNTTIGTELKTAARPYGVSFTGATSNIAGATAFLNAGVLTFAGGGTTVFAGGLDTQATGGVVTSATVATTDTPMDFGDLTIAGNTVIDAQAGKTTFHNDIDNIAAGSFSVLGTGDIELNSTITVNGPVDLGGGLGAPPEVARIYKDTLGDVVITTTGHDFTMGTNQKLTVANGDLTIDATGANAYIGDLNSNGTITVTATGIKLIARGGGQVINLDGVSKSTDNSTSVVAMNVNLNGAVSAGLGRVSTPTSGDFNKGAVSYWTPLKLGGGALPVLVTTGAGTFPAGTPIDLAAGAVLFDLATALATAIPQPSPIAPAATYYPLDPAVKELLEQLGLFARELTPAEQAAYGSSTTFTFDDVIRKPEDEIGPEDYTVPAPRLPEDLVKATVETYRGIFWKENEYQGAAIKATLQKAFDAYKQKSPDAVDPAAFRKFLQDTPDQSDALKLLDDLKKLFEQIGYLGLTSVQQGISQGILVRDIVPTGMTPGQLIAAIKGVAPGQ